MKFYFYFYFLECWFGRYELLSMVKKHSSSLKNTAVDDEQDASDVEMDPSFWHDILDLYFICGRESRGRQDDDLIFFVRKLVCSFFCVTATFEST